MTQTLIKSTVKKNENDINKMFAKIAKKYDLLNNLMTFGKHYKWKEEAVLLALKEIKSPKIALDICSGTGDLAFILKKHSPDTKITCIDNAKEMLDIAEKKIKKLMTTNISTKLLDISDLSSNFKEKNSIDLISTGFGLRNLSNKEECLNTIYSLLKENGVFVCIDLGHPENIIWKNVFYFYFFNIVPILGSIFAKDKDAYSYLPSSLLTWYKQEELRNLILKTGFKKCYFKNILGGAVAIHIAIK